MNLFDNISSKPFKKIKKKQNIFFKRQNNDYELIHFNIKSIIKYITLIICFILIFYFSKFLILKTSNITDIYTKNFKKKDKESEDYIYLDQYETNIYNNIKETIILNHCSQMWDNQREFLNGVIRKFRPKKILEIGTAEGGSACIMLNAMQDIEGSHLYSIDLSNNPAIGKCVRNFFPQYLNKWTLYQGNVAAKFIEQIGNNIDMVFIDSAHYEPGEILDFIIVLPFLKEGAIVGFHDIANQITVSKTREEWAPYIIYNIIRGKPYLPSGDIRLKHDIGIKILENNQDKYYYDYFRSLGGQWQYFPKEEYINLIIEHFKKYYNKDCVTIFQESVEFNRNFVKKYPKAQIYNYNSQ